ncbi:hypothetical protein MMC13_003670 [Lambiella insularis]|nr:hypothetical protein [Lambiella insularis]
MRYRHQQDNFRYTSLDSPAHNKRQSSSATVKSIGSKTATKEKLANLLTKIFKIDAEPPVNPWRANPFERKKSRVRQVSLPLEHQGRRGAGNCVDEVEVDVGEAELLQTGVERGGVERGSVAGDVGEDFGHDEEFGAGDAAGSDGGAELGFRFVDFCPIKMHIARADGGFGCSDEGVVQGATGVRVVQCCAGAVGEDGNGVTVRELFEGMERSSFAMVVEARWSWIMAGYGRRVLDERSRGQLLWSGVRERDKE